MANIRETAIKAFWQENPCGENLTRRHEKDWSKHFSNYDAFRYRTEGHILNELDKINFKNKIVLEIGIGQAADSEQIILRGAHWFGLDLTEAAIFRAKRRFELKGILYDEVKQGSALDIPYSDCAFDIIYSHGVLHHIPDIKTASSEIYRVMKDDGQLVIMLYNKHSLNYYASILFFRRIMLIGLWFVSSIGLAGFIRSETLLGYLQNVKKIGLIRYLDKSRFIHANTDGPHNPYSKAYTPQLVKQDFPQFEIVSMDVHFLNDRHLPLLKFLPKPFHLWLSSKFGWHLWLRMKKTSHI